MSNAVFPSFQGVKWDQGTSPEFSTAVKRSTSGMEYRTMLMQYPLWIFELGYEALRDSNYQSSTEFQQLMGFYIARHGAFDSFLYNNPNDNAVSSQSFGTGDASTTVFQLQRTFGYAAFTLTEPVQNLNAAPSVYVNSVLKSPVYDYTISSTGSVAFNTAPILGATITWSGTFYYRCRFVDDKMAFNNMMRGLWELKKLSFIGSPMNKV